MKSKHFYNLLVVFLLLSELLYSQRNPQPHFRNYSTKHGLPSPETYCIFEDSKGYIWFGTDNGAARFDGYEYKIYGAREGLRDNVVFEIQEDSKNRIWFSTMSGKVYILENKIISPYPFNDKILNFKGKYQKGELKILDKQDNAYFELERLGVLKIDSLGNDSLITSTIPVSRLIFGGENLPRLITVSVAQWKEENALNYAEKELENRNINVQFHFDRTVSEFSLPLPKKRFYGANLTAIKLESNHILFFYNGELTCFYNNKILWRKSFPHSLLEIIEDSKNRIWFCLGRKGGLFSYESLGAILDDKYNIYFQDLNISNFFQDSNDNLWVSTLEKGIFFCNDEKLVAYDLKFGLSQELVLSVAIKNTNELFAGLENGDVYEINIKKNVIINSFSTPSKLHNFSLIYDKPRKRLWSNLGYFNKNQWQGLKFLELDNRVTNEFMHQFISQNIYSKDKIIGTSSVGIFIADIKSDSITFNSSNNKKIDRERTLTSHNDHLNQLWIGTVNGLYQFKDSILIHPKISHPAFYNRVEDVDELPDSTIILGTKGYGIILWKGDSIHEITTDDGLTSNMLEDVHVDENGILWAGTLNGLNKITLDKNGKPIVRNFTTFNGLPSNEINQIKSYEGQLWLCTAGGLVKFHETPENTFSSSPILQWTKINNETIDATSNTFAHDENNFEFRYLTINYRMNGKIPYRYRIQNNAPWQYTQNLNVNYPSLPPDDYTFEVQSQNEDGYWSKSTTYHFEVRPPWWATWWFRTLSVFALGFISYQFYKYRTSQLKKEVALKQQMTDLEKSALQAQMNPHFIFNCLNSIQNFILKNDKKKAVEFLSRFAKLVRHNLNASVRGEVSLEEEINILENYLALEQERFDHSFNYQINVDELLQNDYIEFPPMLIQPYVENAVIHGLSEKEEKGKVIVHFSRMNDHLLVTVQDNAVGYRQNENGEKSKRHKSVGMTVTKKRLELLGNNSTEAVKIDTLKNTQGKVQGTKVSISINIKPN